MAENRTSQTLTAGRDELRIDHSRCLRTRFSGSSCRLCTAACPHAAVALDDMLSINPDLCTGCMLCTAHCPVGALEQAAGFAACLAQLSRVPEPVLGCIRTKESSHAALACLGGLSGEYLVALCHSLSGTLTLNLTGCGDCPNGKSAAELPNRLERLSGAGLLEGGARLVTVASPRELQYRDETVNRRSFFKSLRSSLFQSAAVVLNSTVEHDEPRSAYAEKRLPARRKLLNEVRSNFPEMAERIARAFDSRVSFDDRCTRCQGCVAICPTGALKSGLPDEEPVFYPLLCTGCGLCREFCLDGALQVTELP